MSQLPIEFYWDPTSPYTYLASTQIAALAQRCGTRVAWKPFLLGKVFEATGNRPPAMVPAKGKHLFRDLTRWARHYGVPLAFPAVFPVNSLKALRVACALPEPQQAAWGRAVMDAYWTRGEDIGQPDVLGRVAGTLGVDGPALLRAGEDPAVKDRLRAHTEDAVRRGAFGAPTFFVGEHMFWGNDRLVLLEDFLRGAQAA